MPYRARAAHRAHRKPRLRSRQSLQKPNGIIGPRVAKVGGERFAIVCVDPAKHRSEWMMADYFGNLLIDRQTLEHRAAFFKLAVAQIREAQQEHDIQDMIVVVERTGNYHLAPKRAFAKAGFETRVIHPFATKQYRTPADPGIKTDGTDLNAQHPAYEVRLVLIQRQVLVLKELGIAAEHFVQMTIALRHISVSCLSGSP